MLTLLLLTALYGVVWGFLWGALDAIFILKGFLATNDPVPSIIRSILAMFLASFATGVLLGLVGLGGGSSIISMIVAVLVSLKARPWVMARWRW